MNNKEAEWQLRYLKQNIIEDRWHSHRYVKAVGDRKLRARHGYATFHEAYGYLSKQDNMDNDEWLPLRSKKLPTYG